MIASFLGGSEVVFLLGWPTISGLSFALWERFRLAPRRSLSIAVPAFFAGLVPAIIGLVAGAVTYFKDSARASVAETLLIPLVLFIALSILAVFAFLVSRWLLHTRFKHDP